MKTTLFFHERNDYTGSTRVLTNLILQKYDNKENCIVTISGNGFFEELRNIKIIYAWNPTVRGNSIPFITFIVSRLSFLFLGLFLCPFYRTIYVNTITQFIPALVSRLYQKKLIYHIHEKYIIQTFETKVYEFVFNHLCSDKIYVSNYLKNCYPANSKGNSKVVYNKISSDFCSKITIVPVEDRLLNRVTMLSSLTDLKGIPTYVELARLTPDIVFNLILSADNLSIESYFCKYSKLPKNLNIIPKQSDVTKWYKQSDVVVNLTDPRVCIESFGLTLVEALCYGIPIIGPNVGGPTEIIKDDFNGFTANVIDALDIQSKLRIILNPENYAKFVNGAVESSEIYK